MIIRIANSSTLPIYEQVREQLRDQIMQGALEQGEMLPSIRNLAKELHISVITTKRAYDELEREGFITTVPGKGTFVAEQQSDLLREKRRVQIEELLEQAVELAIPLNMGFEEMAELLKTFFGVD